jgi:class 3 adenylate cyclase/tetratricopeptide (TPR) repeat protein
MGDWMIGQPVACANCGAANLPGSRFCSTCASPLEATNPAAETRKTVTVLFCDATSSTALGERLDPESMRALMTRYFDEMREVIEFHGGVVEKFIGDAVMAVFGVPVVHEDDAMRACRAALEIRERLVRLDEEVRAERGATVEWRMGINTGEVVAGDGASGQRIVTGDAVNVAARLEGAATPGQILLGADTFSLVRGSVQAEELEALTLKGKSKPVAAWRLIAGTDSGSRQTHERPMDAPLVGRRRPLRLLDEAFREVVEDRVCHLFTVLGVAGVGKSRLIDEFVAAFGDQAQVAAGRCLAYGHGITYWPVIEALRNGLGLAEDAPSEAAQARLGELLSGDVERERILAVIGHLLGLVEQAPAPTEIFWGIRRTFEAMARRRPLVLILDDIHWGEPTFLDLVDHIADWTHDAPILLIAMARPELLEKRPGWSGGKRSATTVQLEPLSAGESDELVVSLLGQAELPAEVMIQISRAAEGNPLFVEELLGKLIDDGFLVQSSGGWAAMGDLRELAMPPTISALMAARLDSLGREERTVIERASVEGKTFHRGAVTAMSPEAMRPMVSERLATLTRMELVRPEQASFAGEEAFRFRHLLIRDAAYQALAKQTRSELHERFAEWLEQSAGDRLSEYEEILGYHYEQAYRYRLELGPEDDHAAALRDRAGSLLIAAARRAGARQDVSATVDLLDRIMEVLPSDSADRRLVVAQLGWAIFLGGEAARSEELLERTRDDALAGDDPRAAAWAAIGLMYLRGSMKSTSGAEMLAEAEELRDTFRVLGDREGEDQAELVAAMSLFFLGRGAEATARARAIVAAPDVTPLNLADGMRWEGAASVFGPSPTSAVIALIRGRQKAHAPGADLGLARMLILQGRYDEARAAAQDANRSVEQLGDRMLLSQIEDILGMIALAAGDVEEATLRFRSSYDAKVAMGDVGFSSTTAVNLAEAHVEAGDWIEAERFATIALDTSADDDIASQSGGKAILARVHAHQGDFEAADALAAEAVAIMAATDYLDWHATVLVHQAHVFHEAGNADAAAESLGQAEELYRRKEATAGVAEVKRLRGAWGGG